MNQITKREQKVLHLISYEHSSKEIANKLFVSYETIISHGKNIMRKLDVKNVAGLVRIGFEKGLFRAGVVALLLLCLPQLNHAQDSRMEIESNASGSAMDPLLTLISGTTKRPAILFNEGTSATDVGMSIEYDGRSDGGNNVLTINKRDGSNHTDFFNDGRVLIRGGGTNLARALQVDGNVFVNGGNTELGGNTDIAGRLSIKGTSSGSTTTFVSLLNQAGTSTEFSFKKTGNNLIFDTTDDGIIFQSSNFALGTTQMLSLSPSGNASVTGFTQLGASPPTGITATSPSIKIIELTGSLSAGLGTISIANTGLDASKILDMKVVVKAGDFYLPPNVTQGTSNITNGAGQYNFYWTDTVIVIAGIGTLITNQPYVVTVMYKQ